MEFKNVESKTTQPKSWAVSDVIKSGFDDGLSMVIESEEYGFALVDLSDGQLTTNWYGTLTELYAENADKSDQVVYATVLYSRNAEDLPDA